MTYDEKLKRAIKWTLFWVLIFIIAFLSVDFANAKELPEIVKPSELSSAYDDRRVAIFGYARSCEYMQGRLGSNYIKCVVGGVDVYLDFKVWGVVKEEVIVVGKYKAYGRFGGFPVNDHFIIAEHLFRDWE